MNQMKPAAPCHSHVGLYTVTKCCWVCHMPPSYRIRNRLSANPTLANHRTIFRMKDAQLASMDFIELVR